MSSLRTFPIGLAAICRNLNPYDFWLRVFLTTFLYQRCTTNRVGLKARTVRDVFITFDALQAIVGNVVVRFQYIFDQQKPHRHVNK